ncbi:hypothetical protein [Acaryochloris marina]|uniref:hypothetical protein n=1 Tax=Acaryochloris marina TaxID=155978 RepID=UPI0021C4BD78|nr:hypothetical protein [Acaryochloris marina]BDM78779.1 hypothetical protein AM10699_16480 [Acaryochloris marina MBIC10699]
MEQTPFTPQERVESLKAGGLSASGAILVFMILLVINEWLAQWPIAVSKLPESWISLSGSLASVAISGLLFGVTYRYAIRQDTNPQLKSGVVLAFSLVRGLAQVDTGFGITDTVLPFVLMAVESWVVFSCDRIILDQALQRGWLKPFATNQPAP